MATLEERFEWLKEVLAEKNDNYSDYLKEDIANYLELEEITAYDLENPLSAKFKNYVTCKDKEDIREFVSRIVGYILMRESNDDIIADYLSR